MSNKLKIGEREFDLISYSGGNADTPIWYFNLNAKYDEVLPLIVKDQNYIVISYVGDDKSELDLSDECNVFISLKNIGNETCELVLGGYSTNDLLSQVINTFSQSTLKKAYTSKKISKPAFKRLAKLKIITDEQLNQIMEE